VSTRRPPRRAHFALFVPALGIAGACGPACVAKPPPAVVAAPEAPPAPRPPPQPPPWSYWEPVDVVVRGRAVAPELPLAPSAVLALDGASARWSALRSAARVAVLEHGFAVVPRATPGARFGQSYAALAEGGVPYVVTLDALFWVAHVARDRALAAAEESVLVPALDALLRHLETRLASDARGAPGDLVTPFLLARGVVAVARSLLSPAYQPAVDLSRVVSQENRRIAAHEGPSASPLLGVTIDYSQIVPRGAADASAARASYARAVAWLGAAPFVLAARGEIEGAELSIAQARAHTRAALLVARLVGFEVDVEAAYAWHQWATLARFAGGPSDDVSLRGLLDAAGTATGAERVGMDVRDARSFVDVAKLDRLRHLLLAGHASRLFDGAAVAGVPVRIRDQSEPEPTPLRDFTGATTSVRLLAPRGDADAALLQALVFPSVGKLTSTVELPPPTARDGIRAIPRALDVAAWLGAPDARAILHESGDDAYARYADTLDDLAARRPAELARHDSVYASSLDALATYALPSAADGAQLGASSPAWQRRRLESVLAGWTTLRHDALAFARFPLATTPAVPAAHARPPATLPAFVEPHPEAIGKLLSLVRQTARGFRALGHLPEGSPANPILDAAERLLADAFAIAGREANDEPLSPDERAAILSFPARLAALEDALAPSYAADASLAVDVHTDLVARRALVEGCGDLDDVYVAFREPQSGRIVLAVGAAASHYEVTEPARDRPSDAVWRARLHGPSPPARADYTRAFLVPSAEAEPLDASAGAD
jgi:hypothetical protein